MSETYCYLRGLASQSFDSDKDTLAGYDDVCKIHRIYCPKGYNGSNIPEIYIRISLANYGAADAFSSGGCVSFYWNLTEIDTSINENKWAVSADLLKTLLQYHAEAGVEVCQPAYSKGLIETITSLVEKIGDQSLPICTIKGQVDKDMREDLNVFLAPFIRQQNAIDDYHATEQAERWRREDLQGWGDFHEDDMRNHFPDEEAYQNWIDSSD